MLVCIPPHHSVHEVKVNVKVKVKVTSISVSVSNNKNDLCFITRMKRDKMTGDSDDCLWFNMYEVYSLCEG